MKKKFNKKGFTMVETLIVAVFVVAIFIVIYENYFPIIAKYNQYDKYDDIDTKYTAYYLKDMIESESTQVKTDIKNKLTGSYIYKFTNNGNELCSSFIDENKQHTCEKFIQKANINDIYITQYNTTNLKNNLESLTNINRPLELYIKYMPTYKNTAASKPNFIRLIVEVKNKNNSNSYEGEYFYTYTNIEIDTIKSVESTNFQILNSDYSFKQGDAIALGSEKFYILSINNNTNKVNLLAYSNLNIGDYPTPDKYTLQSNDAGTIKYTDTTTGIEYVKGGISMNDAFWTSSSNPYSYPPIITNYLDIYKSYLEKYINVEFSIAIPTYSEINVCNITNCPWIYNRYYWLHSATMNTCIYNITLNSSTSSCNYDYKTVLYNGIRPMITVPISFFR